MRRYARALAHAHGRNADIAEQTARESISLSAEEALQQKMIDTLGLQYLEALKVLGASPSTKFIVPLEFTGLLKGVSGCADQAFSRAGGGNGKA
jgi:membrane-bound ClpP family serine protease